MSTAEALRQVNGVEVPLAGTYAIDKSHSTVEFVGRHLMITKVRGRFTDFEGLVTIADEPLESSVEATIQAASVDTGDEKRDGHLVGPDFFDVENFPTLQFRSTGVEAAKRGAWKLLGDLTIHGVTRPVTLDLEFDGSSPDPWGGTRIAFTAATEVDREDWGLTWNVALETGGVLVGKKATLEIEAELVQQ